MDDTEIVALFFERDEKAIAQCEEKYGTFCQCIAYNILSNTSDAQECVNDTYLKAWNTIPPKSPEKLGLYLGKIVRNTAINLYNKNHRKKRYAGMQSLLSELEECIASPLSTENNIEEKELTRFLNSWLETLDKNDRGIFIRRYWKGEPLKKIAKDCGEAPNKTAKRMYRLRLDLKSALEKEDFLL